LSGMRKPAISVSFWTNSTAGNHKSAKKNLLPSDTG